MFNPDVFAGQFYFEAFLLITVACCSANGKLINTKAKNSFLCNFSFLAPLNIPIFKEEQ